ncbi:3-phosphoserine/phosphohydroxythreonine transaminase [Legionella spiritensis]|uniref:3-phosphoserine/phosphohydroxythreonine transaminase n=1 Tax=Legionella spiritensis TaxID=452 RepID=UPI0039E22502
MIMRGINFGAGPAMLPESLLTEVRDEMLNWQGTGMSVLEIGHRSPECTRLLKEAEDLFRRLLSIPDDYHVLFIGGAARTHFGMIPCNFLDNKRKAGYLQTGLWSEMALEEAGKLGFAYCVASGKSNGYTTVPSQEEWVFQKDSAYIYYTPNETVNGLRLSVLPKHEDIPLIADMTSCLLTEPVSVADFDMIFAGAQKNIANAGLTVVIIKEQWLNSITNPSIPTMYDYRTFARSGSLYATPPVFNCYLAVKMLQWIENQGGVQALYEQNCEKAKRLYDYIDSSEMYQSRVEPSYRSLVNACFFLKDVSLEDRFLRQASERGLLALKGHRMVGGLRASMYNAMNLAGVNCLIDFMNDFAKEHGV